MTFFFPRKLLSVTLVFWSLGSVKSGAASPTFKFVVVIAACCAVAVRGKAANASAIAAAFRILQCMCCLLGNLSPVLHHIKIRNDARDCFRNSGRCTAIPLNWAVSSVYRLNFANLQVAKRISYVLSHVRPELVRF